MHFHRFEYGNHKSAQKLIKNIKQNFELLYFKSNCYINFSKRTCNSTPANFAVLAQFLKQMTTKNFYEILNSETTATFEELKQNYKQLILQYHPDKLTNKLEKDNDDFVRIKNAWETLKDTSKRKLYDAKLFQSGFNFEYNIFDKIKFDDLTKSSDDTVFSICRCGGNFEVNESKEDLFNETNEVLIECSDCSLVLVVTK